MVNAVAAAALKTKGDVAALRAAPYQGSGPSIADKLSEMVATIGENMNVRRTAMLSVDQGVIGSYLHNQIAPGLGKIGVLVAVESSASPEKLAGFARQLAMHIAATNPVALDLSGVSPEVLEREKAILAEKNAGKPANVLQRIFESGLKSFAKDHTLLEQAYVHDGTKSVAQALKEAEAQSGAPLRILGFVRFQLGEGIEKEAGDFAAEVAKAAQGS
jgi:elongation factor Ts